MRARSLEFVGQLERVEMEGGNLRTVRSLGARGVRVLAVFSRLE